MTITTKSNYTDHHSLSADRITLKTILGIRVVLHWA